MGIPEPTSLYLVPGTCQLTLSISVLYKIPLLPFPLRPCLPARPPTLPCSCRTTATPWHLHLSFKSLEHSVYAPPTLSVLAFALLSLSCQPCLCDLDLPIQDSRESRFFFFLFEICSSLPNLGPQLDLTRHTQQRFYSTLQHLTCCYHLSSRYQTTLNLAPTTTTYHSGINRPTAIRTTIHGFGHGYPREEIQDIAKTSTQTQEQVGSCNTGPPHPPSPFAIQPEHFSPSPSFGHSRRFHGDKKQTNPFPIALFRVARNASRHHHHHVVIHTTLFCSCFHPPCASTYRRRSRMYLPCTAAIFPSMTFIHISTPTCAWAGEIGAVTVTTVYSQEPKHQHNQTLHSG